MLLGMLAIVVDELFAEARKILFFVPYSILPGLVCI
jgi:hypothetical protein